MNGWQEEGGKRRMGEGQGAIPTLCFSHFLPLIQSDT